MRIVLVSYLAAGLALVGCANDPVYIPGPMAMDAGVDMMGMRSVARASVQLPIKTETAADAAKRTAFEATLDGVRVPYVKIGDIEIEVEWTIKNLDNRDGKALIGLNGANEFFIYDPSTILLNPDDDNAAPTPDLAGDIPLAVPANGQISGLFTEDNLREAAIDLDQITRGNVNPFRAWLTISKNAPSFQPMSPLMPTVDDYVQTPVGAAIPRAAFAQFTRIDMVFTPTTHMVLEYNIRIRDTRGIMHALLLTAQTEKPGELAAFTPEMFTVMIPTTTPP